MTSLASRQAIVINHFLFIAVANRWTFHFNYRRGFQKGKREVSIYVTDVLICPKTIGQK